METVMGELVPTDVIDGTMVMTPKEALAELERQQEFIKAVMIEGVDYGVIPGTGNKKTLLKPGAEKLSEVYGYAPTVPEIIERVEKWDASPPFFHYLVKVALVSKRTGRVVAEGVGSCNSMEVKYRYRPEYWNEPGEPPPGQGWQKKIKKNGGRYWQRPLPNEETADLANTYLKMAKKRAHVDATLSATRCSGVFTQDAEDIASLRSAAAEEESPPPAKPTPQKPPAKPAKPLPAEPTDEAKARRREKIEAIAQASKDFGWTNVELAGFIHKAAKRQAHLNELLDDQLDAVLEMARKPRPVESDETGNSGNGDDPLGDE